MPNAIIYVFSGTYHTLKTAMMLKTHLENGHIPTRVVEVRQPVDRIPPPEEGEIVGFGYPIHAFNTPQLFLKFVRGLPAARRNRAFIFKTSGEPFKFNDASSYLLYRKLRKKGYDVVLETHLLMPYNIMFRYPDGLAKQMALYSDAMCRQTALRLLDGERDTFHYALHHRLLSAVFRIEWFGAWFNGLLYRVNMEKCTECQLCVKNCPACNISFDGEKFHFARHCTMCMRCAMHCPENAINIGLFTHWKVNGPYPFARILSDPDIPSDFINPNTKGYFRLFRRYYKNADESLMKYGIAVPGHMPAEKKEPPELRVFEECQKELSDYEEETHEGDSVIMP